jgi:hypothetical protein
MRRMRTEVMLVVLVFVLVRVRVLRTALHKWRGIP